ncbi:deleted in malignant brain tumors 1 protein-like [Trematomus bernacchii]|uniref:deleted in malignant brain tumors 1 protein-like n=1 Tax=Trematomus bernacchii TaxID=40690 RepID=UPI00146CB773|nr:deleted in malignant brain tumors 1 protein-like [Trematomus bernacchii]
MMRMTLGMMLLLLMQTFLGWTGTAAANTPTPPPPNPPVRLVGSTNSCSGRVEIFHNGTWGTVCDDSWDLNDAHVVCGQLGCGRAVEAKHNSHFGQGTGPIWLDDLRCSGNETSLKDCVHSGIGSHNCRHHEDAGVICEAGSAITIKPTPPPPNPPVRLVGSTNSCSGRVEIFHNGTWGTVCDDSWDLNDAHVVCGQLGCGRAVESKHNAHFGQGTGPIWLDDLRCSGNETSLKDCVHSGIGSHNCRHHEDAGVICEAGSAITIKPSPPPPNPPVRLVGSTNSCSGRVEIFHNGTWGTVCDDSWDLNDAHVVCGQLGCGRAVEAKHNSHFGQGTGPIWLDDLRCSGNETSLKDCVHSGIGSHNCRHHEDAGVICEAGSAITIKPTPPPPNPPVRLVGSTNSCSGRVEIFHNGTWGTVCDDSWDLNDAHVVCGQLGCGRAVEAKHNSHFGQGTGPIWLDDLRCSGNETSLKDCVHSGIGSHNCRHHEDAGVICEEGSAITIKPTPPPPNPPVRLVSSTNSCSGRVEIFHNGTWGTVCDDSWDLNDAQVVCGQLGCGRAVESKHNAHFGQGTGPIWLDDLRCSGNETSLKDCVHSGIGSHNCRHREDAGVICEAGSAITIKPTPPPPNPPVRLVGSTNSCSGRVEIFHNGTWGTVCDDSWDLNDAHVVCGQLGCGRAVEAKHNSHFGQGTGPIWLDDLRCSGNETSLKDCVHSGIGSHNCRHHEDAGVICEAGSAITIKPTPPPPNPPVRLVGSTNSCSGRVEIFHNGTWGTVCDDSWDLNDAHVVCGQLGCGRAVESKHNAHFGQGTGPIWLDDLRCSGNETSLKDCVHSGIGSHNCRHHEDAGVICEERPPLLQTAHLVCSRYQIKVGLRLISLQAAGLQPFSGHMAVPFCSGYFVRDSTIWYQVPRQTGQCGTVMRTNTTHAIYSNNLFFDPPSNGYLVLPQIIPFSCAYPLETNISLNAAIRPLLNGGGLIGSGNRATAYMALFHDSNFSYRYHSGLVTLPMGSPLYVQVFVSENDPNFAVVLEDCYTTNSSNPQDHMRYYLIHSRCPTDLRHVSVIENGQSLRARFSALLFPLHGGNPYVFLHCTLRLCDKRTQNCVPHCRRTYRSVDSQDQLHPVTIGPITFE